VGASEDRGRLTVTIVIESHLIATARPVEYATHVRTERFHSWVSRSSRLLSLLLLPLAACGSTPPDSTTSVSDPGARELAVEESSAVDTDSVAADSDEAPAGASQDDDEARTAPCTDALDCTIVTDACGAPHARAVSAPDVPAAPDPCPPVGYAPVEPACESGACVARVVEFPELRTCEGANDCVAIRWSCGGWWAVARAKQREAEAHARMIGANRACRASTSSPRPQVACVAHICIQR
jgi:hypothetical protein